MTPITLHIITPIIPILNTPILYLIIIYIRYIPTQHILLFYHSIILLFIFLLNILIMASLIIQILLISLLLLLHLILNHIIQITYFILYYTKSDLLLLLTSYSNFDIYLSISCFYYSIACHSAFFPYLEIPSSRYLRISLRHYNYKWPTYKILSIKFLNPKN